MDAQLVKATSSTNSTRNGNRMPNADFPNSAFTELFIPTVSMAVMSAKQNENKNTPVVVTPRKRRSGQ
jgi:hypothetical protein